MCFWDHWELLWKRNIGFCPQFCPRFLEDIWFLNFVPVFVPKTYFAFSWDLETHCAAIKKDAFQRPWINWVIRLISPHLLMKFRQQQGLSDGRNERCCSQLRICSYRAGFSHPPDTPSKPLQPHVWSWAESNRCPRYWYGSPSPLKIDISILTDFWKCIH